MGRKTMGLNKKMAIALAILIVLSILYSSYLSLKVKDDMDTLTKDQKEMMEFLETWKKCV